MREKGAKSRSSRVKKYESSAIQSLTEKPLAVLFTPIKIVIAKTFIFCNYFSDQGDIMRRISDKGVGERLDKNADAATILATIKKVDFLKSSS